MNANVFAPRENSMSDNNKDTNEETTSNEQTDDKTYTEEDFKAAVKEEVGKRFEEHRKDLESRKLKEGKAEVLKSLGLNPDSVDLDDPDSVQEALNRKRELENSIPEEKLEELKSDIRKQVESEYEPFKERATTLEKDRKKDLVHRFAENSGFQDPVVDGPFRSDFENDVFSRTKYTEEHGLVLVDEDDEPIPSTEEGKTYKGLSELFEDDSFVEKWGHFRNSKPQQTDSGLREGTTERTYDGQKKSDFTQQKKWDYIKENGSDAWFNLPD
jgi:hypothetical protein